MASSSLANIFSFFTPSKPPSSVSPPPKTPPSHLSLSSDSLLSSSSRNRDGYGQLVASNEGNRYPLQPSLSSSPSSMPPDLVSVVCPSLAYANTLFFRSYNVQIAVDDNEPEEKLVGRFRREVMRAGIIQECKRRRFYENKQEEKKRKTRESAKRNRRRRPQAKQSPLNKQELPKTKRDVEEEDNWELPDGDLPF